MKTSARSKLGRELHRVEDVFPAVSRESPNPGSETGLDNASQVGLARNSDLADEVRAEMIGGASLEQHAQKMLAPGFGHNLNRIRIHADAESNRLANAISARAFTTGEHIFFSDGAYSP